MACVRSRFACLSQDMSGRGCVSSPGGGLHRCRPPLSELPAVARSAQQPCHTRCPPPRLRHASPLTGLRRRPRLDRSPGCSLSVLSPAHEPPSKASPRTTGGSPPPTGGLGHSRLLYGEFYGTQVTWGVLTPQGRADELGQRRWEPRGLTSSRLAPSDRPASTSEGRPVRPTGPLLSGPAPPGRTAAPPRPLNCRSLPTVTAPQGAGTRAKTLLFEE